MEIPKKSIWSNNRLNSLKLYFAMSLVWLLASPNDNFAQNQNSGNISIIQHINAMNVSEYNKLLKKRDQITTNALAKFDHDYKNVTDYLEQTQQQIFLNSFKNNKNLVRSNLNEIKSILVQNFKIEIGEDPIEILNAALMQIAKEEKMNNLGYFTNKISKNKFDIATINAYWYVQASNKNTWKDSNGELMPTFNIASYGSLETVIALLKNGKYTANYNDFSNYQHIETEDNINNTQNDNNDSWNEIINLDENVNSNGVINLDDDETPKVNGNDKNEEIKKEPVKKEEIKKDDVKKNPEKKDDVKKNDVNNEINLDHNNGVINLDDETDSNDQNWVNLGPDVNKNEIGNTKMNEILDNDEIMEKNNQQKKLEEIYQNADEETREEIKKDIVWWDDNKIVNLDDDNVNVVDIDANNLNTNWVFKNIKDKIWYLGKININENIIEIKPSSWQYESIIKNEIFEKIWQYGDLIIKSEFFYNSNNQIDKIELKLWEVKKLEINNDMSVMYNFNYELRQELPIEEQKQKIEKLIKDFPVLASFVNKLEKVWIYFNKWDNTNVNRTAAILRSVNGNFWFGDEAIDFAIEWNVKWSDLVGHIILQAWASDMSSYQLNLMYNNFKNPANTNKKIILDENMFVNDNLDIVQNMSWNSDVLSKKLSKDKLNNISYQGIIDVVSRFKSDDLKKAFMYALLNDDIIAAQKVMWMDLNCHSRYPDYKADNKIGTTELNKIKKLWDTRKYIDQNDIMANKNIPQDVKNAYNKFVSGEYNNKWKPYTILSKTDFNMYLFSTNHILLSRQNTLIWVDVWDQKNDPYAGSQTTPTGMYEIWNKFDKSQSGENFFQKYWTHYVVLIPLQWQYTMSDKYSMWIHWTYENDPSRDTKIKSNNAKDRRDSNGCINTEDAKFGELFNHATIWWIMFITSEPSNKEIQNFLANNK